MSFREIAENKFFQNLKIEDDSGVGQTRIGQSGMARKKNVLLAANFTSGVQN
jgi:hypothetical protein